MLVYVLRSRRSSLCSISTPFALTACPAPRALSAVLSPTGMPSGTLRESYRGSKYIYNTVQKRGQAELDQRLEVLHGAALVCTSPLSGNVTYPDSV